MSMMGRFLRERKYYSPEVGYNLKKWFRFILEISEDLMIKFRLPTFLYFYLLQCILWHKAGCTKSIAKCILQTFIWR